MARETQQPKHTPLGSWHYTDISTIEDSLGETIAECVDQHNGPLLASAPDLLTALEEMTAIYRDDLATEDEPSCVRRALAAIARAKGSTC